MAERGLKPQAPTKTTCFWAFSVSSACFPTCCLVLSSQHPWAENGLSTDGVASFYKAPEWGPGGWVRAWICCPHWATLLECFDCCDGNFTRVIVGGVQISFRLSLCLGQKYEVSGRKFSPLVYQPEWVLPFAETLGKSLWQSWDPAPVYRDPSPCLHSFGENALIPLIDPYSQELDFHLRILNINSALKKKKKDQLRIPSDCPK